MTLNDKLDKIKVKLAWECGLYHFMTGHLGYYNFHDSTEWNQKIYEVALELARSFRLRCDVKQDFAPLYRTDVELDSPFRPFSVRPYFCYLEYRTRAIITRGLYTFYPLFEVHVCTVTFGLMYG